MKPKKSTDSTTIPPEGRPNAGVAVPPAQPGDAPVEVKKAVAEPVHQSLEDGRKELDAHPARTSTLTSEGRLVRE